MSCVFLWPLGKVHSKTGLLRVVLVLLLVFPTFFLSPDLRESVPPVSFEFLRGKKIEWVLIIGVSDISELLSK